MSKDSFKYDVTILIEVIKAKPAIWDKSLEDHKDKFKRANAWQEVFELMEPEFLNLDDDEQKRISDMIYQKWKNIRDAFIRSVKLTSTHSDKKKYLHYDQMQFLMKNINKYENLSTRIQALKEKERETMNGYVEDNTELNLFMPVKIEYGDEVEELCAIEKSPFTEDSNENDRETREIIQEQNVLRQVKKSKRSVQENPQEFIEKGIMKETCDKILLDEDEAFFVSIMPSVKRMKEDGKLEFRMGVLQLIKDIKKNPDFYLTNNAHSSVSSSVFQNDFQ